MIDPADIPPPHSWEKRHKSLLPMPGGYAEYVDALKTICELVSGNDLAKADLNEWFQNQHKLTERGADERTKFLFRAGVLESSSSQLSLSDSASRWYEIENDSILIALLHSRTQFFGEMLAELSKQPLTAEQLRRASKNYGLNWDSLTQVNYRRGWLESANLIGSTRRSWDVGFGFL